MNNDGIKILICSDYQPEKNLLKVIQKKKNLSKNLFGFLSDEIKNADIAAINVEYPITDSRNSILKSGPVLKAAKESLIPLAEAGFNLITLANNHIANFGNKGVLDTIDNCKDLGLDIIGAGMNLNDARKIFYKEVKGEKIAILNFAEIEFNSAAHNRAGANPLDLINNIKDIKKAKSNADYVILIIHSGYDFVYLPVPEMVRLYRFYAGLGASAIISHHSHYVSSYETYKNVPIFYSLGNLIHAVKGFNDGYYLGFSVALMLNKSKVSFRILPHYFDPDKISINKPNAKQLAFFNSKIEQLNDALMDFEVLSKSFGEEVMMLERTRYLVMLNGWPNDVFRVARKLHLLKALSWIILLRRKRFFLVWNILRCEHHQDVINATFNKMFSYEDNGY